MSDLSDKIEPVETLRAWRVSAQENGETSSAEEEVGVVVESPLTIDVEGIENYTLLCTPTDTKELAVGFLRTEGIIEDTSQITHLDFCEDARNTIRVRLTDAVPRIGDPGRNLLIVSSCGACGSEDLDNRIEALPDVGDTLRVDSGVLRKARTGLSSRQTLFERCGGTHAAGVYDATGTIIVSAEDAGRHNALDKAIGKCLLSDTPTAGKAAALSGRVSLEMVSKCARAGIELISAISAPTTLAIDVADRCGITLCAFVRETRATVFTHPKRITDA
jgi:FdhD protein